MTYPKKNAAPCSQKDFGIGQVNVFNNSHKTREHAYPHNDCQKYAAEPEGVSYVAKFGYNIIMDFGSLP